MKRYFALFILLGTVWFAGCSDEPGPPPVDTDPKTLIMFGKIAGFADNILDAATAVAGGALIEGQRLIVFDGTSTNELYELVQDKTQTKGYRKDLIKTYDRVMSSLDPARMREILEDAKDAAPANHYGLTLGTHGTGWLPLELGRNVVPQQAREKFSPLLEKKLENAMTRNVNHEIDIEQLSPVLEGLGFDFIILDQCLMGGIEVVYEMRNTAPYLIVSPAEIMMTGFPFQRVVRSLFKDWNDLGAVCYQFIDYYNQTSYPYATISLIKTSEVDALKESVKAILDYGVNSVGQAGLQYFYNTRGVSGIFYDFRQYIEALSTNDDLTQDFITQLNKTVIHTDTTGRYFENNVIDMDHYSGLTSYVPDPVGYPIFYASYQKTAWYRAITGEI